MNTCVPARSRNLRRVARVFCTVLLVSGLFPVSAQEAGKKPDPALIQSLVFPGLGQIREKQYIKGILLAVAEGFCIVQAFTANRKSDRYYWEYRFARTVEETVASRQLTERFDRKRNQYILIGAGIWILNMVDIHWRIKRKGKPPVDVTVKPNTDDQIKNPQISLAVRF